MAGLRTLLNFPTSGSGSLNYDFVTVWNTNTTTMSNGGCCCLWTVPANVTWAMFEVWGGGGGGGGACCCMTSFPGGSGSYARKIITGLSSGQTFTVCAGGTTNCSEVDGQAGNPSFVRTSGGTVCACASGGSQGLRKCFFQIGCSYSGCPQQLCGSYVGSFGICGSTGSAKGSSYCSGSSYQFMPSAPFTAGMSRPTKDGCSGFCGGCCNGGYALFPGGGGAGTFSHTSGPFCGAAGAGGLVKIYYARVA